MVSEESCKEKFSAFKNGKINIKLNHSQTNGLMLECFEIFEYVMKFFDHASLRSQYWAKTNLCSGPKQQDRCLSGKYNAGRAMEY